MPDLENIPRWCFSLTELSTFRNDFEVLMSMGGKEQRPPAPAGAPTTLEKTEDSLET